MIEATTTAFPSKPQHDDSKMFDRRALYESALVFAAAGLILFLLSSRVVNVFDEGILLTGTMRTMAGQVLHRDFNYNYGPAQFYLLAGLFNVFGSSVLVERVAGASFAAGLVASVYALARKFCGRTLAFGAAIVCMLWSFGMWLNVSLMNAGLCILILWTSWLIVPSADEKTQRRRAIAAGFLAAIMFFFRYDMGIGTILSNLLAMVIMWSLQGTRFRRGLGRFARTEILPYLAAFLITVTPGAIAYLSVAPLHDLLYDVVIYMAKYYRLGRGLPFPVPHLGPTFREIAVYLLPVIIGLVFSMVARWLIARKKTAANQPVTQPPEWVNLLTSLGVAAAILSVRGLVRVGIAGMYGSAIVCILLLAVLLRHRTRFNLWLRGVLTATAVLFVLAAVASAQAQLFYSLSFPHQIHLRPLVINWILTPDRQPPSAEFRGWCRDGTPITRGFCFLLDGDHIQAVRYLNMHTQSGDYLYVGLQRHDRIFANDMVTYFATQRLPAVKWTEFDPFIENRTDIQQEMIGTLEQYKPPYVVLDSEFDAMREPNGSSVSTGVHLLDDYIAAHYKLVQQYGELTILQRKQ